MIRNGTKNYLSYSNKLVDQYNDTYHHSTGKKPINSGYSALTEKIETNLKAPTLLCPIVRSVSNCKFREKNPQIYFKKS